MGPAEHGRRGQTSDVAYQQQMDAEAQRIRKRRARLGQAGDHPEDHWGLALSGGGIRSATFALGVLQALSRLRPGPAECGSTATPERDSLLARFDYLSTVSGGGYIGGFFGSLFVPGRLQPQAHPSSPAGSGEDRAGAEEAAARQAYAALQSGTPERLREPVRATFERAPGRVALAWLRDNGRYLAPTGAGDALYGVATAVRGWIGLHYVLGTLLLSATFLLGLLKIGLMYLLTTLDLGLGPALSGQLDQAMRALAAPWWSVLWLLPGLVVVLWILPCVACYWLTYAGADETLDKPSAPAPLFGAMLVAWSTLLALGPAVWPDGGTAWLTRQILLLGTLGMVLTYVWLFGTGMRWRHDCAPPPAMGATRDGKLVLAVLALTFAGLAWRMVEPKGDAPAGDFMVGLWAIVFCPVALGSRPGHGRRRMTDKSVLGIACLASSLWLLPWAVAPRQAADGSTVFGAGLCVAALACAWARRRGNLVVCNTASHRVAMTRALTLALAVLGVLVFVGVADTLAQSLVVHMVDIKGWIGHIGLIGGLTWAIRQGVKWASDRKAVRKALPLNVIAGLAGLALAMLLSTFWLSVGMSIEWHGARPAPARLFAGMGERACSDAIGLALTLMLAFFAGMDLRFLNMSTYAALYGARLTRAYLGASNGRRFDSAHDENRSSAEPVASDHLSIEAYAGNPLAPVHLVNVCLNQNVDPAEQLIQRDRKGRPLAVVANQHLPNGRPPVAVDGWLLQSQDGKGGDSLSLGEWLAVSGAAVSTALGRRTSLGTSFVLGLANLRLGRWWRSGIQPQKDAYALTRWARKVAPMHVYLLEELFGRFYGLRRGIHYLTDGGHFDNTGIYELLRPERGLRRILACDCGADPAYRFDDIANLIRLARIDFGLDLRVDEDVVGKDHALNGIFGLPSDFGTVAGRDVSALLLQGYRPGTAADGPPDVSIVVIKPVVFPGLSADLVNFRAQRPEFPQESTADQFFDEAQWESYRRLGVELTERALLGMTQHPTYRGVLWDKWNTHATG